uniref:LisH domain-containing protein n=1 Tax=Timema douglasi TaxID=61478 RepID=A0A7R8VSI7_TIMDO|nr:unnamed protein product [Timema douglasi]
MRVYSSGIFMLAYLLRKALEFGFSRFFQGILAATIAEHKLKWKKQSYGACGVMLYWKKQSDGACGVMLYWKKQSDGACGVMLYWKKQSDGACGVMLYWKKQSDGACGVMLYWKKQSDGACGVMLYWKKQSDGACGVMLYWKKQSDGACGVMLYWKKQSDGACSVMLRLTNVYRAMKIPSTMSSSPRISVQKTTNRKLPNIFMTSFIHVFSPKWCGWATLTSPRAECGSAPDGRSKANNVHEKINVLPDDGHCLDQMRFVYGMFNDDIVGFIYSNNYIFTIAVKHFNDSVAIKLMESEATTPDTGSVKPLHNESIKPHEQRALNFLINEYLLLHGYKLTSITFADENEHQDFEDWDDVGLNIPKPAEVLTLYRDYMRHAQAPCSDMEVQTDNLPSDTQLQQLATMTLYVTRHVKQL